MVEILNGTRRTVTAGAGDVVEVANMGDGRVMVDAAGYVVIATAGQALELAAALATCANDAIALTQSDNQRME